MSNDDVSQRERYLGLWTSVTDGQEMGWELKDDGSVSFYKNKQMQPGADLRWSLQPDHSVVVTSPMGEFLARFNEAGGLEITPPEMLGATMAVFEKSD